MSLFSSPPEARLGSLGVEPLLPCPPLPNIVSEWAAILPLVCHLAGQRDDYITTGEIALMGRLSVGIFPRLGTLSGLARLLDRGTKYLDHASTRGGSSRTVYDVKWGSVFPCANGAACAAISRYLLSRDRQPPQRMPETRPPQPEEDKNEKSSFHQEFKIRPVSSSLRSEVRSIASGEEKTGEDVRRYQVLHVYQLNRKPKQNSLRQCVTRLPLSLPGQLLWSSTLLCLAILFCLIGCFGPAALVVCNSLSQLVALRVPITRPSTYLRNNEMHDACMLVASHENASEWHLFIGDRGVADTLLNKPMFMVPKGRSTRFAAGWFWFANLFQLTAMTYVAAQKGWDGVWLVALLAVHWALRWSFSGRALARDWLEREGIDANVRSFEFGGRYAMMGAIQVLSKSTATRWMDNILVPHPRREAWLGALGVGEPTGSLNFHDQSWLEYTTEASLASAEVMKSTFGLSQCQTSV
ncbi:hypothetical protein PFICI_11264 [Pestalotiopsis fici W106-1]|uniref:Uncharacterized protein n=1 Tax=Pestalotiopsis fici (strain W106-1 / CGMCC3.15140) TaxID=1229662 RepID=W3WU62_PESFW|nr:uncharacterized protein PFICI_11264 [Pestalotiopsis fici W106-1]ETS77390.1 hypothetical protein PFICI_11264 [Pestalotiopsis fici W106-1]